MNNGKDIEAIRKRYGISKAEMSRLLRVPYPTVVKWCTKGTTEYMPFMIECAIATIMKEKIEEGNTFINA